MSRKQLLFALLICPAWLSTIGSAMAQQGPKAGPKSDVYLALGDSLPFGYNPLVQPPELSDYIGYPSMISVLTRNNLTNASCPFETTGTFLSGRTTPDGAFGCQIWRTTSGLKKPLFVSYTGPQIVYAESFLQSHTNTRIVTIQLGGNDLGDLQLSCNGDPVCEQTNLPATLGEVAVNLGTMLNRIRVNYSGPIVLVNYYAFNYANPVQTAGFGGLATDHDRRRSFCLRTSRWPTYLPPSPWRVVHSPAIRVRLACASS